LHINAGFPRQAQQRLPVVIFTNRRDKTAIDTQSREVLGNVSRDASCRGIHRSRVRVLAAEWLIRFTMNVDVGAADDGDELRITRDVTAVL